jgi:16S rRNA (guanine966-N2)-methyltransferase
MKSEVRIIGGRWKRSRLAVADWPGLRPTPDRVRETLFNWLGQDLSGKRVLDAFAGSGALGFEAASRGAAAVTLLESDPALVKLLRDTKARLGADMLQVLAADALAWMGRAAPASFDLVLIDPPFDRGLWSPALQRAAPLLAPGGMIYLEAPRAWTDLPAGYTLHRQSRAGSVHFHLLAKLAASDARSDEP